MIKIMPLHKIIYRVKIFRESFGDRKHIELFFAVKSNNNFKFLKALSTYVDGFDTATIEEFYLVKDLGCNISFTSPGVLTKDIKILLKNNVFVDFDSISQLNCYLKEKKIPKLGIRININDFGIGKSRFGISLTDDNIKYFQEKNLIVNSIHFHTEQKDSRYTDSVVNSIEELIKNKVINPDTLEYLNLGGGFLESFINDELENIIKFIDDLKNKYFAKNNIIKFRIEPGAALAMFSAYLLTEILSVKNTDIENSIVLNASAHNLTKWFNTMPVYYTAKTKNECQYSIYGNTCYEHDVFLENVRLKEIVVGDKLILFPFGAYTRSNSSNLHSMNLPKEAYYKNGKIEYD